MIGCLCIHGFTGAPYEVEPLAKFLQEKSSWRVVTPTLPGHGETLSLKGFLFNEWISYAEHELQRLLQECEKVYVIGFSMGGLIASYLAAHYPVERLVLLSAAAYYVNTKQLAADIKEILLDSLSGRLSDNELFLRYRRKIKETPLEATWQFRKLVKMVRPELAKVNTPTFIAQGEIDGIVPPKSAQFLYERIGAEEKRLVYIKSAKHLICHCSERDHLFKEILDFLKSQPSCPRG